MAKGEEERRNRSRPPEPALEGGTHARTGPLLIHGAGTPAFEIKEEREVSLGWDLGWDGGARGDPSVCSGLSYPTQRARVYPR